MHRHMATTVGFGFLFYGGLLIFFNQGCVTLKPVVLDQKTQLENQILGMFQRLEGELILASSVRGPEQAPVFKSSFQQEALDAMLTREFYQDDIEIMKQEKIVGEGKSGKVIILSLPSDTQRAGWVKMLVTEENKNREIIFKRIIQLHPELKDSDLPLVQQMFFHLVRQTARPGELLEKEGGGWEEKKSE